jgi:gluconate:H+ symporter, GntP family
MNASFSQELIALFAGIAIIIFLTTKYQVHAFFALLLACLVTGLSVQLAPGNLVSIVKEGFGNIMKSLGLIIVLGTTLGVLLEHTGSTRVMANYILKKVGQKNSAFALSLTGFIVGLPVFCDSGFIVLNGLNKSLTKKTGLPVSAMSVSLATGLYSVHCLIPPHPGAAAAASTIGSDYGKLILYGIIIAIPAMLVGHWWAVYAGKKIRHMEVEQDEVAEDTTAHPAILTAFLPVIIPILLIALRSFFINDAAEKNGWLSNVLSLGEPVIALCVGVLLAFAAKTNWKKETVSHLLHDAVEKAGGILVIIGAGGAFGAVLAATNMGVHFSEVFPLNSLGILFPFLVTFLLKTAQGSSTVAIITAASIVQPLLPALGLDTANGKLLVVLSMGAGSMMISHANDAYFWVITKFSGLDIKTTLKVYSVATIFMGLTTLLMVYLLSFILS